jgi:hypothetical protein
MREVASGVNMAIDKYIQGWPIGRMATPLHAALKFAVELAGGQSALADFCGCKRQIIHQALVNERGLPAQYVERVSARLGIPKNLLRPDIYPREP